MEEAVAVEVERVLLAAKSARLQAKHPEASSLLNSPIGLALSGGGVRASAYHCGVLWALASQGLMKDVQHLASVSGGAYTAVPLATHFVHEAMESPPEGNLDQWYSAVVARTVLRMQRNIDYVIGCTNRRAPWKPGSKLI